MNKLQGRKSPSVFTILCLIFCSTCFLNCQSSNQETASLGRKESFSSYYGKPSAKKAKEDKKAKKNSSKKDDKKSAQNPDESEVVVDPDATVIKVEKKDRNYFSTIDSTVLADIEIGSPQSIRRAILKIKKATIDYPENERVLYNIASSIMSMVWSSERELDSVPPSVPRNNYLAIIESAKNGIYEEDAGANDFFEIVLPSLVLTTNTTRIGYYDLAEKALAEGLKKRPDSVLCNYLTGLLYKKRGNFEKAVSFFDKATESNAVVYEVLYEKANCLIQLRRYEQVANILDKLMIQFPSDINVLKLYANTALLMNDYVKAEQYASLVLQQNPSDLEFVLFRAKIFVETGEYLKASSLLDVYGRTYPENRVYLLLRSKIQKEWNKNLSAAVATIEKALSLYPNDADVILYAARLASETKHPINGKSGGELAAIILNSDPQNTQAIQVSVQSLYNEEKYSEAYTLSKRLMSMGSGLVSDSSIFTHIKVCLALRYNDEAWRYVSSLYEKDSSDPEIIQFYIEVMVATGRTAQASRLINSLLNASPSSSMKSFLYYERSFLSNVDTTQLADLRSSLIANPRNSDALFRMYQIYYNRKDYRKAQYYLKQVVSLNPNDERYIRLNSELDRLVK
ncbi:tetratricopeptide repeat protein [Treponema sp.]|uniref:tetratricopeptide repeat protein n=1 Tax=Treponema sp. TaxID=166 RepID=UPI00298E810B|nr:tetratricopeptide repeat protein [Treponema sp.]MCR5612364.1 tetratricopeptide repeat protein [Treponema sp.]